jgi:hypothetical protein
VSQVRIPGWWVLFLCCVVVGGANRVASQPASPEPVPTAAADPVERASWQGELTGSSLVEVSNPFGDLRLRYGGSGRTVEVAVALQQLDPAGSRLALVVDENADPATVRVVRNAAAGPPPATPGEDQSRADMVVLVPRGIAVRARTDRGLAESVGLESDVELETSAGQIRVRSTRGRVTARSDRGEIMAMLLPGVTKAPQRFSTVTGSIEVWVSDTGAFDVALATSGRLITDFSMQVEHLDREEPDKVGTVRVGAGGHPLELWSRRGDLSIRRLVEPDQLAVPRTEGETEP